MNGSLKRRLAALEDRQAPDMDLADLARGEAAWRKIFPWAYSDDEIAPFGGSIAGASVAELLAHPDTWDIPEARRRMEAAAEDSPILRKILTLLCGGDLDS
jgi:hypothetical protein